MKIVILCGGLGSRLAEETRTIPKPMVKIGNKPILSHITDIYEKNGFKEFILALGYKSHVIKKYYFNKKSKSTIHAIYTGKNTLMLNKSLKNYCSVEDKSESGHPCCLKISLYKFSINFGSAVLILP